MPTRFVLLLGLLLLPAFMGCYERVRSPNGTTEAVRRDEARFNSGDATLAARITRPVDGRGHPGVVILHAAGLNVRDNYRPFADSLAARGIVVLAYDMRGAGDSEGKRGPPTFQQLSQDAGAALRLLRAQNDIDLRKVGLWALSRGGYTAPAVAVADSSVRFLIIISSPALPVAVSDSSARVTMARDAGSEAGDIARAEAFVGILLRAARYGGADYVRLQQEFREAKGQTWFSPLQISTLPSEEWLTQYGQGLSYDPDSVWRRVNTPTLLIYGADDLPRLVRDSRARILSALAASGARVDAPVFADADHLIRVPQPHGDRHFVEGFFEVQEEWIAAVTR